MIIQMAVFLNNSLLLFMLGLIHIASENCTGLINLSNRQYVRDLLDKENVDVLLLQEMWLSQEREALFASIHPDYMFTCMSGMDTRSSIVQGRPYGGVAILFNKKLAYRVKPISSRDKRTCAVIIDVKPGISLLIICCYLPCDNRSQSVVEDVYTECLNTGSQLIEEHNPHGIIVGGDLNTDLSRNRGHSSYLKQYCDSLNLFLGCNIPHFVQRCTYDDGVNCSIIDHFLCSKNMYDNIVKLYVNDDVVNPSNHHSIHISASLEMHEHIDVRTSTSVRAPRINWNKAKPNNIENCRSELNELLKTINIDKDLIYCNIYSCSNKKHKQSIDKLCPDVVKSCLDVSVNSIPSVCNKTPKSIPYWKELVEPAKESTFLALVVGTM